MSDRMVIAICGLNCSGKDTLAEHLVEQYGFKHISLSAVLRDVCNLVDGASRDHMLRAGTEYRKANGHESLMAHAMQLMDDVSNYVITSVRFASELTALWTRGGSILRVGLVAPESVRFKRSYIRKRYGDPSTRDSFARMDERESGGIWRCMERCDVVIQSNGDAESILDALDYQASTKFPELWSKIINRERTPIMSNDTRVKDMEDAYANQELKTMFLQLVPRGDWDGPAGIHFRSWYVCRDTASPEITMGLSLESPSEAVADISPPTPCLPDGVFGVEIDTRELRNIVVEDGADLGERVLSVSIESSGRGVPLKVESWRWTDRYFEPIRKRFRDASCLDAMIFFSADGKRAARVTRQDLIAGGVLSGSEKSVVDSSGGTEKCWWCPDCGEEFLREQVTETRLDLTRGFVPVCPNCERDVVSKGARNSLVAAGKNRGSAYTYGDDWMDTVKVLWKVRESDGVQKDARLGFLEDAVMDIARKLDNLDSDVGQYCLAAGFTKRMERVKATHRAFRDAFGKGQCGFRCIHYPKVGADVRNGLTKPPLECGAGCSLQRFSGPCGSYDDGSGSALADAVARKEEFPEVVLMDRVAASAVALAARQHEVVSDAGLLGAFNLLTGVEPNQNKEQWAEFLRGSYSERWLHRMRENKEFSDSRRKGFGPVSVDFGDVAELYDPDNEHSYGWKTDGASRLEPSEDWKSVVYLADGTMFPGDWDSTRTSKDEAHRTFIAQDIVLVVFYSANIPVAKITPDGLGLVRSK